MSSFTWSNAFAPKPDFFGSESRKSTNKKTQESTCLTSSPLPGDAPPNAPAFCWETGGMTTHGQFYKQQGSRGKGRGRGKVKTPSEAPAHMEVEDDKLHLKEQHTLTMTEENANRVSSLDSSPFMTKLGIGHCTSILFKKAKNGAKLTKSVPFSLQNRVSADKSEKLPDHRSQMSLLCIPPTPKSPSKENGMEIFFILFNQWPFLVTFGRERKSGGGMERETDF